MFLTVVSNEGLCLKLKFDTVNDLLFSLCHSTDGWLVASFSPHRPGFATRAVRMGFMVDKVALAQVFL
jgi:hypothetical protein